MASNICASENTDRALRQHQFRGAVACPHRACGGVRRRGVLGRRHSRGHQGLWVQWVHLGRHHPGGRFWQDTHRRHQQGVVHGQSARGPLQLDDEVQKVFGDGHLPDQGDDRFAVAAKRQTHLQAVQRGVDGDAGLLKAGFIGQPHLQLAQVFDFEIA